MSSWPGNGRLIATCGGGLEGVLADELRELGFQRVTAATGAVSFAGGAAEMRRANHASRIASRILVEIAAGSAGDYDGIYAFAASLPWEELIRPPASFRVHAVSRSERLRDSRFAALRVKDAIADRQRRSGKRSSVQDDADVVVSLFVDGDNASIALDSSARPLHERGYRTQATDAPLRESLAAGLIRLSGWSGGPFYDPFCGSGTIAIEAALIASGTAPGDLRTEFGYQRWPFIGDLGLWQPPAARQRRSETGTDPPRNGPIYASDVDPRAVAVAKQNARRAGVESRIEFSVCDFRAAKSPAKTGTLIANLPYGERLPTAGALVREVGDGLKQRFGGWQAWLVHADRAAMKELGLRVASRTRLWNGGLEVRLYHVPIHGLATH